MPNPISDHVHALLSRSLPLLQAHKEILIDAMRESLGTGKPAHRLPGRPHAAASALVEMLVGRVRRYLEAGDIGDLGEVIEEHRELALDGRHYSRFGDALVPVLKDVLGPTLPRAVASAWCDAFWVLIRTAKAQSEQAPA
jgi:hemoglobin-like flavoprotein